MLSGVLGVCIASQILRFWELAWPLCFWIPVYPVGFQVPVWPRGFLELVLPLGYLEVVVVQDSLLKGRGAIWAAGLALRSLRDILLELLARIWIWGEKVLLRTAGWALNVGSVLSGVQLLFQIEQVFSARAVGWDVQIAFLIVDYLRVFHYIQLYC